MITHLRLSNDDFGTTEEREAVFALEGRIASAAERVGCFHDGNQFGGGEVELFTYGPDADVLFGVIEESLRGFEVRPGSYAIKRYGADRGSERARGAGRARLTRSPLWFSVRR